MSSEANDYRLSPQNPCRDRDKKSARMQLQHFLPQPFFPSEENSCILSFRGNFMHSLEGLLSPPPHRQSQLARPRKKLRTSLRVLLCLVPLLVCSSVHLAGSNSKTLDTTSATSHAACQRGQLPVMPFHPWKMHASLYSLEGLLNPPPSAVSPCTSSAAVFFLPQ
jgi:hypothetical protein